MQVLMAHGLAAAHATDYRTHAPRMSPQLQAIFQQGLAVTPADLAAARAAQHSTRRFVHNLLHPPSSSQPPQWTPSGAVGAPDSIMHGHEGGGCVESGQAGVGESGGRFHVALSLPVLGVAPLRAEGTGSPRPASLWSLCGAPAVAVPWGLSPAGLPLAVQLSAAPGCDRQLLAVAVAMHDARQREAGGAAL